MIKVEDPNAYRFIMQDEIYLLAKDKTPFALPPADQPAADEAAAPVSQPASASPAAATTEVKTPGAPFNYLGGNNNSFLILTYYPNHDFIEPAHLTALESILKRKETGLQDVAIVNTHKYPGVKLQALTGHFKPQKMLILGAEAMPAGMPPLKLNSVTKGKATTVMYSFSFADMMTSNENKKAFWDEMKKL